MKIVKISILFFSFVFLLSSCKNRNETNTVVSNDLFPYEVISEYKEKLNSEYSPFVVNSTYYSSEFDFNNDNINDYTFAYTLYSQFQFVIFDGISGEIIFEETIMMDFIPSKTICEIYSDNKGDFAERFTSKFQKAAYSEITETIQIITNSQTYMFEAVYDKDTGKFMHCYDKYNSLNEYTASQNECLTGYSLIGNITWNEYIFPDVNQKNKAEISIIS